MIRLPLSRALFTTTPTVVLESAEFTVTAFNYPSGIASLKVENSRGYLEILPFMGQMIWDANFDGHGLRMDNMFSQPVPATEVTDTYGCFAFHSGLLAAGCPSPEDTHPLHGEFPVADMDQAWLEYDGESLAAVSSYEYVKGFGNHYEAKPSVVLRPGSALFDINLEVTNLSAYAPMPLQYMCHMNYAFVEGGIMRQSIPDAAFALRRTIPAHVTPTPAWTAINEEILAGTIDANSLERAGEFDPEIVYFADDLPQYGEQVSFELEGPDGVVFETSFNTNEFPVATRWILVNPDQKVAAFVLPGTSRPEGRLAAQAAGTLMELGPQQTRSFSVTTGIKE